ncbi:MAG: hypothetical protein AB7G34_02550, partial [Hyphomicrobiales bacterium]
HARTASVADRHSPAGDHPALSFRRSLEHDPEKWIPLFRQDHAQAVIWRIILPAKRFHLAG